MNMIKNLHIEETMKQYLLGFFRVIFLLTLSACDSGGSHPAFDASAGTVSLSSNQIFKNISATDNKSRAAALRAIKFEDIFRNALAVSTDEPFTVDGKVWRGVHSFLLAHEEDNQNLAVAFPTVGDLWDATHYELGSALTVEELRGALEKEREIVNDGHAELALGLPKGDCYGMVAPTKQGGYQIYTAKGWRDVPSSRVTEVFATLYSMEVSPFMLPDGYKGEVSMRAIAASLANTAPPTSTRTDEAKQKLKDLCQKSGWNLH